MAQEFNELSTARILVVASDLRLRLYLGELLLTNFTSVQFVNTADKSLELLKHETFDVVITDYYLDDMDGIDFRTKMIGITTKPFFVLLTAHASDPKIQTALKTDQFIVLQKPPHPDELILPLRSWFRGKKIA